MKVSKVLITGATGFIGSRLCERFKLYYKVPFRAFVRNFTHAKIIARFDTEMVKGDLLNRESIQKALIGCDGVIHLAHSDDKLAPKETKNLLDACLRAKIKAFVHVSSIAVHGPKPGAECTHEKTAIIRRHYGESYSDSKAKVEKLVNRYIKHYGLPGVILRPTLVYGPYSGFVEAVIMMASKGEISLIDNGNGVCNAVYIDDVCDAIYAAIVRLEEVKGEVFFINADHSISWREFNLTFGRTVDPSLTTRNYSSEEVLKYWRSHRTTLRSTIRELVRLAVASEFHRQLGKVAILNKTIRWIKSTLKEYLSEDQVLRLKRKALVNDFAGEDSAPCVWPMEDRVVRETMHIYFSNELAKKRLAWNPLYDFRRGSELTRFWLEFTGLVPPQN
jgi:nucleoside-diphosphate-sugar epimerase